MSSKGQPANTRSSPSRFLPKPKPDGRPTRAGEVFARYREPRRHGAVGPCPIRDAAGHRMRGPAVALCRAASQAAGIGKAHQQGTGGAPRAGAGKSPPARHHLHYHRALCRETYAGSENALARADGEPPAAYGATLLPIDFKPENPSASPALRDPYERPRASLHRLSRQAPPSPAHGLKMRYANPLNGGH